MKIFAYFLLVVFGELIHTLHQQFNVISYNLFHAIATVYLWFFFHLIQIAMHSLDSISFLRAQALHLFICIFLSFVFSEMNACNDLILWNYK